MDNLFDGLRAALFDLDGTLIETHIDFDLMKRAALALATRRGLDTNGWAAFDILRIVETGRERLESAGRAEEGGRFRTDAFTLLEEIEVAHCANPVEIPGAAELLSRLRARHIPVAVVTRNCRTVATRLLAAGNLVCDALLTRDDVPHTKPHPDHLFAALAELGVGCRVSGVGQPTNDQRPTTSEGRTQGPLLFHDSRLTTHDLSGPTPDPRPPTPFLMVGDHWMDVQAGRAAGMRTIGILRGKPPDFFAPSPPDLLVEELKELLDFGF